MENYILLMYLLISVLGLALLLLGIRLRNRLDTMSKVLYKQEKRIEQLEFKNIKK